MLQRDLIEAFFRREQRFFLTGGAALVGYYFHHRATDDLDFFTAQVIDLALPTQALRDAVLELGGSFEALTEFAEFRRYRVRRGEAECVVDLVCDRAPAIDVGKNRIGNAAVDTPREIAANKVCTLIGRSQIRDLVDLEVLLESGISLETALEDAAKKEVSADPLTLAWVLDQVRIGPQAPLPGGSDATALEQFRVTLVARLRALAAKSINRRKP